MCNSCMEYRFDTPDENDTWMRIDDIPWFQETNQIVDLSKLLSTCHRNKVKDEIIVNREEHCIDTKLIDTVKNTFISFIKKR